MTPNPSPTPKARRGSGTMQFLTQEELKRLLAVITTKRDRAPFLLGSVAETVGRRAGCAVLTVKAPAPVAS